MDNRCAREYIILDVGCVVLFYIAIFLFWRHIPNVSYMRYIYLAGLVIMGIALIIKILVNVTRILQDETPKGMDDAFPLVMGPGILALLISSFYSIFVDENNAILFNVYGKQPQVWFLLLFALCLAARLAYYQRLKKRKIQTTGNFELKIFDCAAMVFLLVFSIIAAITAK